MRGVSGECVCGVQERENRVDEQEEPPLEQGLYHIVGHVRVQAAGSLGTLNCTYTTAAAVVLLIRLHRTLLAVLYARGVWGCGQWCRGIMLRRSSHGGCE